MSLVIGQILQNRYRIDALLGQGGFGAVYRATDLNINFTVALKENQDFSSEAQRQFVIETSLLVGLRHPGLPRVTDYFFIPGQGQYLVMDYIAGQDLKEMLDQHGPLGEARALAWMGQVLDALAYLHTQNPPIVHRDIKPANIRVTPDGRAVLVDFGIAKLYDPRLLTTTGARAVTEGYSPWEQYGKGGTDQRSDVYAAGATLYALLTGQVPPESMYLMAGTAQLVPPRRYNPRLSPWLEAAVLKAMSTQPTGRYTDAGQMRAALVPPAPAPVVTPPPAPVPVAPVPTKAAHPAPSPAPSPSSTLPPSLPMPAWMYLLVGVGIMLTVGILIWIVASSMTPVATPAPAPTTAPTVAASFMTPVATPQPVPTVPATLVPTALVSGPACKTVGQTMTWPQDNATGVCVPAGEFLMGSADSDKDAKSDEKPQHTVYLDAFWIDRTEVTNTQYKKCAQAGKCKATSYANDSAFNGDNQPVVGVNWNDAKSYCEWAGRQLPTEAQWEKAARGTDGRIYPWGNTVPDSNRLNNQVGKTTEVGKYPAGASPYGALDMAGNVYEWVADWYAEKYYASSPSKNPTGPSSGQDRACRGGFWNSHATLVRAANRSSDWTFNSFYSDGFRCVGSALPGG